MKKAIKTTLVFGAAVIMTKSSMAQKGLEVNLGYNIATPVGSSFRNYVSKTTFGSYQGSFLYGVTDRLKLGVQVTFADYHEKRSATLDHKVKTVPLVAKGEYSFMTSGFIRPYVGLGAGIDFINYHKFTGSVEKHVNTTKAAFTGDAGFLIPFTKTGRSGFRVSTSFNLLPYSEEGVKHLNSFNVQAGISLPITRG